MDLNGVKRRDTTKGPPLRILSLDGGGVRGYSMLIIIQELMHRTYVEIEGRAPHRNEIPKPCDHFDLIVGTGTGGLIALMLGRLRLDLETCKQLYVRLTRMVFETDKTIAGIPYRSTLFKASKLEEAIREAVREHTVYEKEGNDGTESDMISPLNSAYSNSSGPRRHTSNASTVSFSARSPQAQMARPAFNSRYGNPNARLYDARETRTKTAVLAMYRGSRKGSPPAILRSYDSRREPPPEFDCKIWQAGRATCAIGLAFKPIQIGQSVFHDDGAGTFNPAPEALDEAVLNEWPGREVGVFVSVGTGRRPKGSDANQHVWYEGFMGDFAEARRKLISKIEGCEAIHEQMRKEHLAKRNVSVDNYYRLNVEVGVGEFGMNEWHRLADISTGTRQYLRREVEQRMVQGASAKLAKIHKANIRFNRALPDVPELVKSTSEASEPFAVELPADIPSSWPPHNTPPSRQSYESGMENLHVPSPMSPSPRSSGERLQAPQSLKVGTPPVGQRPYPPPLSAHSADDDDEVDRLVVTAPTPAQYRYAAGADKIAIMSPDEHPRWQSPPPNGHVQQSQLPRIPPPLPPKTPLPEHQMAGGRRPNTANPLPYPVDDEPPPVNMARKPDYRGR
ncbi:Calcium-independent phospholipase A2-gamma [Colletotrichum siamense]|uniref:Calcium-independent phospholipase A2-gamma n=1 Tax=Colletotrichum siamense TaxID=690259 RepID=A0A9P5BQR6_COLSI|nr:Calcium-independent phospholipase A2-gamma [Colletotrichum siamense]KAF4843847.1 Calcium-independent phospholipase A2-gamma [Colletotrichum siamense]